MATKLDIAELDEIIRTKRKNAREKIRQQIVVLKEDMKLTLRWAGLRMHDGTTFNGNTLLEGFEQSLRDLQGGLKIGEWHVALEECTQFEGHPYNFLHSEIPDEIMERFVNNEIWSKLY